MGIGVANAVISWYEQLSQPEEAFTGVQDVSQNPAVVKAHLVFTHATQRCVVAVNRYAEGWKRHQGLWKTEKGPILEKFKVSNPTFAEIYSSSVLQSSGMHNKHQDIT